MPESRAVNKVKVGFFSFTEITDPGHHRSYNEWHQLDHMPEQFPIPGIAYGQRWVLTPSARRAAPVLVEPFDAIHYMTLYFITEPVDATLREFYGLGRELHKLGRFHEHRRSHFARPMHVRDIRAATRVLVSPQALPFRPHRAVYVIVETPAGDDEYQRWHADEFIPAVCALEGVAGAWTFASDVFGSDLPWTPGDHRVSVIWIDGDPRETAVRIEELDRDRRGSRASDTLLAACFTTITPWEWTWFDDDHNEERYATR